MSEKLIKGHNSMKSQETIGNIYSSKMSLKEVEGQLLH